MSWTFSQSTRSIVFGAAVISLAAFGLWMGVDNKTVEANSKIAPASAAPSATFNGTGVGNIPDLPTGTTCQTAQGAPLNVNFNVTGLSGPVSNVALSTTASHTWAGDITATLIAPNGATHSVFGRVGATTATGSGDASDFIGTYTFADANATPPSGGFWQAASAETSGNAPIANGAYRTTGSGGASATNPMPATSMNTAFSGVANANGTWTLRLTDGCVLDTGAVSAAVLTVDTTAPVPVDANTDFNGDGKTDYVIVRGTANPFSPEVAGTVSPRSVYNNGGEKRGRNRLPKNDGALAPPIYWYSSINGTGVTGVGQLGDAATDFVMTEDFDGDGKDDLVVWTEGAPTVAAFRILQTSNFTVRVETFGQTLDDPSVVGDYDGDGKADPAVYRCPETTAGQCFFFFRGSLNNPGGAVTYVPWGVGVLDDYLPYVGDFDGDGKNDFCVQRNAGGNAGQFVLLKSTGGTEFINWGFASDAIVPGDYDGDGKTDFLARRLVGTTRENWILTRTGAVSMTPFGTTDDVSVPGDYDGDGKTDLAIWRGSATSGGSAFWVLNSSNQSTTVFQWGICPTNNCDFPVAGWAVR